MKTAKTSLFSKVAQRCPRTRGAALRILALMTGAAALIWFLLRVIPKPSRASYPCQQAAFPVASAFVVWLVGCFTFKTFMGRVNRALTGHPRLAQTVAILSVIGVAGWTLASFSADGLAAAGEATAAAVEAVKPAPKPPVTDWNFIPSPSNQPVGVARGIFPGRVTWAHDPLATKWSGRWQENSDQWWLDENTDQSRVDHMLATTLTRLTGTQDCPAAWQAIFAYYNQQKRGLARGYQPGEVVAIKINLNNSGGAVKTDNLIDASPQTVLAMVRQLVNEAKVRPEDIIVYDARRYIPPYILTKTWSEFKDVRFVQEKPAVNTQPKNPATGDYNKLEGADWVEGVNYSNGKYKNAKLIPKQIFDATYLVNLAILKAHSYPYNDMEKGDSGQTGITMGGKNHFGSIKGTAELHAAINTDKEAVKNAYSPMVDLAASPNLGGKTILYVLDGLYCGRKWKCYPAHFPNPPFNNRVEPYENPDWPASLLASFDGVALDSVGLDLIFAQTKNNNNADGHPRILIRVNAGDYLREMATPDRAPSGTPYMQAGKPVTSLGVHEHWDSDETKRYSRNIDPATGQGIELLYIPITASKAP